MLHPSILHQIASYGIEKTKYQMLLLGVKVQLRHHILYFVFSAFILNKQTPFIHIETILTDVREESLVIIEDDLKC